MSTDRFKSPRLEVERLRHTLRVAALSARQSALGAMCLAALEETPREARMALARTSWARDLDRLDEVVEAQWDNPHWDNQWEERADEEAWEHRS